MPPSPSPHPRAAPRRPPRNPRPPHERPRGTPPTPFNPTDRRAIDVIDRHGRITAGELARELRLSTGAVTTVVDRLEHAGFARRARDEQDRRRVLIEVTPVVGELSQRIYGSPEEAFAGFATAFSDEEFEVLHRFQQLSQTWLEERLVRVEQFTADKRDKGGDQAAT